MGYHHAVNGASATLHGLGIFGESEVSKDKLLHPQGAGDH